MSTIKAVFCDMDGTLLNPAHRISDFTADTLKKLKAKGVKFIVCTGRPYPDVFATVRKCGLEPDYIITSNGGRIHDGALKLLKAHDMDPAVVAEILRIDETPRAQGTLAQEPSAKVPKNFSTNLYKADQWWTDKTIPEVVAAYDESFACTDYGEKLRGIPTSELTEVHEVWFLGERSDLLGMQAYMQDRYGDALRCSFSLPYLLDCVPAHVTKGNAVREVCGMLGLELSEIACFGDGMNDAPMLEIAGYPFLMENAQDALKAHIPNGEVIGTNADDGVARKLVDLFQL